MPGDKIIHSKTIAIVKGVQKTKHIITVLTILLFIAVNYFAFINYTSNVIFSSYLAVFVGVPLLYFAFMIKGTVTIKEFHKLSNFLKVVMLLGILSILFY
jgi:4-hydroxybenzoate polyprenyltransferase